MQMVGAAWVEVCQWGRSASGFKMCLGKIYTVGNIHGWQQKSYFWQVDLMFYSI